MSGGLTTEASVRRRRRLFADIGPLRESAEFRRLWIGGALSAVGGQMTSVAVPVQIYSLTHSSLAVGLVGLALAVPLITIGLLGGSFADAVDRRTLVLVTSSLLALVSLVFAAQALLNLRQAWLLYALIVVQSSLFAIDGPARRTFTPRLFPAERLPAVTALTFLYFHASLVVGPLLAGLLIAARGFQAAYAVDALTFVFALYPVFRLRPMPPESAPSSPGVRSVIEGLRFVRRQPVLAGLILADLNATIFGMPRALFPALAATHFGGGARAVGLLYAAPAIGGLGASTFSGGLGSVRRQGLAMLFAIGVWGAAIAGFAVSTFLWLGVLLLAIAGAADVVNGVFRTTMLQVNTPDRMLGRISSVGHVVGVGGPDLGDIEAGAVATLTSPVISAVSGGLACVAGTLVLGLVARSLVRYEAKTGE